MGEVVNLPCVTRFNLPPERVIEAAREADLEGVVVLGYSKDGSTYFAGSYADGGTVMWLMELCKAALVRIAADLTRDDGAP